MNGSNRQNNMALQAPRYAINVSPEKLYQRFSVHFSITGSRVPDATQNGPGHRRPARDNLVAVLVVRRLTRQFLYHQTTNGLFRIMDQVNSCLHDHFARLWFAFTPICYFLRIHGLFHIHLQIRSSHKADTYLTWYTVNHRNPGLTQQAWSLDSWICAVQPVSSLGGSQQHPSLTCQPGCALSTKENHRI